MTVTVQQLSLLLLTEIHSTSTKTVVKMPPLQDNTLSDGRRASHRGSAIVPREVLLASQLGLLEPPPEEPCGVCIYARNSILTQGEEMMIQTTGDAFKVQSTTGGTNCTTLPLVTRRSGKRRESRNSAQIKESTTHPCAWMACIDNSCKIS